MYADVVMNGQEVNLSIRASSENEARLKLQTASEYKRVTKIIDVSPYPPRKQESNKEVAPNFFKRKKVVNMYTGGTVFTY